VWGTRRAAIVSASVVTVCTIPLGFIDDLWMLAAAWIVVAGLVGFVPINLQHLAAIAVPDNRGGALSSVLSFRFFGHAIGPLLFVPLLADQPEVGFAAAGALGAITVVGFAIATRPTVT
jgi:MFS family permease